MLLSPGEESGGPGDHRNTCKNRCCWVSLIFIHCNIIWFLLYINNTEYLVLLSNQLLSVVTVYQVVKCLFWNSFHGQKNEASNTCHLTGLLHLTANVHERFGDLRSQVTCLQQLCSLHPYHQWHWMKLAQSYLHLLQSLSSPSGSSPLQRGDDSQTEEQLKEERDGVWLKACMCFVRAR